MIQIIYKTGYKTDEMPERLKTSTLEIVDWHLKRMRGGQIGAKKPESGSRGRTQTFFEKTMPEHVQELLAPFKRKRW